MRCPSCGAAHSSEECPAATTSTPTNLDSSEGELRQEETTAEVVASVSVATTTAATPRSRLIEFPGVTRRNIPAWRKELSERVREVQERRAREVAAEAEHEAQMRLECAMDPAPPQLELLPPAEVTPVNPIVANALRRIERAHQTPAVDSRDSYAVAAVAAAAVSVATDRVRPSSETVAQPEPPVSKARILDNGSDDRIPSATHAVSVAAVATASVCEVVSTDEPRATPERSHNLVVVTTPSVESTPPAEKPRPKRLISDDDPALSYLDAILLSGRPEMPTERRVSLFVRLVAGIFDLLTVALLSSPIVAIVEFQNYHWREPRVAAVVASGIAVIMFLYLTISTALTGKTLGLKILSLRVIDARTGMIPTGKQAAGRAVVYILSLLTAGIAFLAALARDEGKTVHDRLSRTSVVRA